jgi:hypothetical protein
VCLPRVFVLRALQFGGGRGGAGAHAAAAASRRAAAPPQPTSPSSRCCFGPHRPHFLPRPHNHKTSIENARGSARSKLVRLHHWWGDPLCGWAPRRQPGVPAAGVGVDVARARAQGGAHKAAARGSVQHSLHCGGPPRAGRCQGRTGAAQTHCLALLLMPLVGCSKELLCASLSASSLHCIARVLLMGGILECLQTGVWQ